jgi:hypothetical protein
VRSAALVLLLASLSAVSADADAGWIAKGLSGQPNDLIGTESGVVALMRDSVLQIAPDGRITSATDYPSEMRALARAGAGYAFAGITTRDAMVFPAAHGVIGTIGTNAWAREVIAEDNFMMAGVAGTADGSVIAAGDVDPAVLVMRFSPNGDLAWQRRVDYSGDDRVGRIVSLRNGDVLLLGRTGDYGFAVRLDGNGRRVWDRLFAIGGAAVRLCDAVELPDGDVAVTGFAGTEKDSDVLFFRMSSAASLKWQRLLGGGGAEYGSRIALAGAGRLGIVATTGSFGAKGRAWLVSIDSNTGNVIHQSTFANADIDERGRVAIAFANGDLWVAAEDELKTVLARMSEGMRCPEIAETSATARAAKMGIVAQPVEISDAAATVKPFDVSARSEMLQPLKIACDSAAAAPAMSAAKPQPKEAADERAAFRISVAKKLLAKQFVALDSVAAELRSTKPHFDTGSWKLQTFFDTFDVAQEPLTAAGRDKTRQLLDEWYRATKSNTSRLASAFFEYSVAWAERGGGFNNTVTESAAGRFEVHLAKAVDAVHALDKGGHCDAPCLVLWIQSENLGGWSEPLRRIVKNEPAYWHAYVIASYFLLPQWGGGDGDIEKFAVEAANATRLVLGDALYMKIINEIYPEIGYKLKIDWPRMRNGFESFLVRFPRAENIRRRFVFFAWKMNDRETAKHLLADTSLDVPELREARAWALEPELRPAGKATGPTVHRTDLTSSDGVVHPLVFMAEDAGKTFAITAAEAWYPVHPRETPKPILKWIDPATNETVRNPRVNTDAAHLSRSVLLDFNDAGLRHLVARPRPVALGDKLTVIACQNDHGTCKEVRMPVKVATMSLVSRDGPATSFDAVRLDETPFDDTIGAPVVDDRELLVGVTDAYVTTGIPIAFRIEAIAHVLAMPRTALPIGAPQP